MSLTTTPSPVLVQTQSCLVLRSGYRLQWEPRQEAWVLLFPEGMVVLSETAQQILELCRQPVLTDDLIASLQARYPGEEIRADVLEFLQEAFELGWLESG